MVASHISRVGSLAGGAGSLARVNETPEKEPARVLTGVTGSVAHITLNRPRAINALDLGMVQSITTALDVFANRAEIRTILLSGTGERGLCAGGDVRGLHAQIVAGQARATTDFFRAEYAMNVRIAEYGIPVVALADGVTMGGGIGLAGHAALRVVTERSALAMPETRIGFTPDVGGTWLLGRAPGRLGEYLGLTGASMDASDAMYAGFADIVTNSDRLDDLREALEQGRSVADVAVLFQETPEPSRLQTSREWIDAAFSADTVAEIVHRLRAAAQPEANMTAEVLESLSPTALTVTLAAVRRARELPNLRTVLAQEYGLVSWFVNTQPDLAEGIRAQLVDKDRSPRWQPATLAELAPDVAEHALGYRPPVPLWE